jgi:hypothetical protein
MAKDKTPQGTFGAPPPGAPQETAAPLDDRAVQDMIAKAQANERTLAPFAPTPPAASNTAVTAGGAEPSQAGLPPVAPPALPSPPAPPTDNGGVQPDPLLAVGKRPAESDTDSPSRGMPRPIADPGKQITGGFGNFGELQYFPMDGSELRELVLMLLDKAAEQIRTDLRFSIAMTYPRVTARVRIEVEGYATDANFAIEKVRADERVPIDVAREYADEVVFILVQERREFDEAGEPENPPDRLRDELGLVKPRKQMVQAGASRIIVDVPSDLGTSF